MKRRGKEGVEGVVVEAAANGDSAGARRSGGLLFSQGAPIDLGEARVPTGAPEPGD